MGGGTSKTTQVQTYLTDSITNIVNDELTQESTTLSQSGYTNQIIRNVVFKPYDGCPWWSPSRNLDVTQESINAGIISKSVENINTGNLTAKIANHIEAVSGNKVDKKKDGMLAFTDSSNLEQRISMTDITRQNIERSIRHTAQTIINQGFNTNQTIENVTFYLPCGDTTVTQRSVTKVMANLFARNVVETTMESEEVRNWVAKVTGEDKQVAIDPFNSLFNNASAAVGHISSAFGSVGIAASLLIVGVVILVVLMLFGGE